jgi:hypothetical protein
MRTNIDRHISIIVLRFKEYLYKTVVVAYTGNRMFLKVPNLYMNLLRFCLFYSSIR